MVWEEHWPADWSSSGIFFERGKDREGIDLWILPVDGDRQPYPVVTGPGMQSDAKVSPNGKWVAYAQRDPANMMRSEVYAQNLASGGTKQRLSTTGGRAPRWRRDGKELFYVADDGHLVALSVDADATNLQPGVPRPLFKTGLTAGAGLFAVSDDGERFLLRLADERDDAASIVVLANWPAALRQASDRR